MPRYQDSEFIARTAFTNLTNTSKDTEPIEHDKPNLAINEQNIDDKNSSTSVSTSMEIDNSSITKSNIAVEEIVSDSEQIIDEHTASIPLTNNECSTGSPLIENRRLSESTYANQTSAGSLVSHDGPLVSAEESPLVMKRSVNDSVIQPLTGTVFRKVTLKKRRVDTRNLPPGKSVSFNLLSLLNIQFYHSS